jgi:membrane protease YdiL (CAAX protease family)
MKQAMQRTAAYSMSFLLAMMIAGFFSSLYIQQLIISLGFLSPIFVSRFFRDELQFPALSRATPKNWRILLLLPLLLTAIGTVGTLSALLYDTLGIPVPRPTYPQSVLAGLLILAVLPALCEEFFGRYVILGTLLPYGRGVAILISSLTFALAHLNFYQIPYAFAAGLVFAYVTVESGSLLPAILFHFINNLLSVISVYADIGSLGTRVYSAAVLILALILTPIYFYKREGEVPAEKKPFRMRELLLSLYLVYAVLTLGLAVLDLVVSIYVYR